MDVEIGKVTGAKTEKLTLTSGMVGYVISLTGIGAYYSVSNVTVSEGRNFVEHTMPGRKGSIFQDMGRPAIKITIEGNISEDGIFYGLFRGGSNKIMLEELHKLCDAGKPVDFLCDMPALFGVSSVIIEGLEATEVKGRKHNYNYKLTLKEWSETSGVDAKLKFGFKMDAAKTLLKKSIIVLAVGGVAGHVAYNYVFKKETLSVKVQINKRIITADESVDIKVEVNDSKGNPIADADVEIKQADKSLFSGKSNADGLATVAFQSPDAGNFPITATAKKSEFSDGSGSASITVDTQIKARLTADKATIKATDKATLKLVATDCNGKAIEGVEVTLACAESGTTLDPASGKTDAQGVVTAKFSATAAKNYDVTATAKKSPYSDGSAKVTIKVMT